MHPRGASTLQAPTAREPVEEDVIGGYRIPAGSNVIVSIMMIQRDPRFFEAPKEFRLERRTPEFEKQLPRFAFFPFGGGPRVCIGMRMAMLQGVLMLAEIVRRFRLEQTSPTLPRLLPSITMRPTEPVLLRLHHR